MEKGNENIFDTIPAVRATGTQVISEKALFRITFTEKVTENSEANERCAVVALNNEATRRRMTKPCESMED